MSQTKFNYLLYICLFILFIQKINADCTNGCKIQNKICVQKSDILETCDSDCQPNLLDGKCYPCGQITNYYYFDSNNACSNVLCSFGKVIFNSKQCISGCDVSSNLYEMGDYCFTREDCQTGNRKIDGNKCDCQFLKSKSSLGGREFYHCYNNGEKCGSEHTQYDAISKICGDCDTSSNVKKYEHRDGKSDIMRCGTRCESNEMAVDYLTCMDKVDCPDNYYLYIGARHYCFKECKDHYPYYVIGTPRNECKRECNDYIYDDLWCKTDCPSPYYKTLLIEKNEKRCSMKCNKADAYYSYSFIDEDDRKCVHTCPQNRYKENNICTTNTNCYIKNTDDPTNNIRCFSSCKESGYQYYMKGSPFICYNNCPDGKYHNEGEFECLNDCRDGNTLDSYYVQGYICYCLLYAIENNKKVCYQNDDACLGNYSYKKGNECLKTCNPYYEVEDGFTSSQPYLKKCYNSIEECKSNGYFYYNTYKLKCWNTCPQGMYSNEIDKEGKPKEDSSMSTCVTQCSQDFPKHTNGMFICKKECDNGEYYYLNNPNVCYSSCDSDHRYIGENNECLKTCENNKYYFELGNGKRKCVSSCSAYGRYYVKDNPECLSDCRTKGMYFYNSDKRCLSNCLFDEDEQFSYQKNTNKAQPCKADNEGKFYYDDKILKNNCGSGFISAQGSYLCVKQCNTTIVYNNYCVNRCPEEAPYYDYIGTYYNCVNKCNSPREYVVIFKNKCVADCPTGYSKNVTGKICYPNCKFGEKYNLDSGTCTTTCASYYEKTNYYGTNPIYVCRSSCMGKNKYIKDLNDKECVEQCPTNNNYIKKNSNQCLYKCEKDDFFKETTITGIYQCLDSCPTEQGYFYVYENNKLKRKCYNGCPTNFNFVVVSTEDKFKCLSRCPSSHPFYIAADKGTKSYYTCLKSNPCSGNNNYYYEGKCRTGDECKSNFDKLYVENNICVDKCSNSNIYKKSINSIYRCQSYCDSSDFIDTEKYCLAECPQKENFINNDKYCLPQCSNSEHYYYPVQTSYPIYKCTEFCPKDDYTLVVHNSKECVRNCQNTPKQMYLSENEKKCYYSCLDSTDFKYTIKEQKKCFSSCNTQYPYYYENEKICLKKCNTGDYAYTIPDSSYIFKCIDSCTSLTGYYTYTKSPSTTEQYMFCYKKCPSDKPYADNKVCLSKCPTEIKFFVKEFKHSGDDLQKQCLQDCPTQYPYYTIYDDENNNKAYGCLNNCDEGYKLINYSDTRISATLCMNDCPDKNTKYIKDEFKDYKYKIIDKNNKTCYTICPPERPYYKNINLAKYKDDNNCYKKCPDETPFIEINQFICKSADECAGEYIDYETKTCLPAAQNECPPSRKYKSKNGSKYMCLNNCIDKFGKYLSPFNTCVNDCVTDFPGKGFINDPKSNKCICENLFFINENLEMECLLNSKREFLKCKNISNVYSIKMYDTKECVKTCNISNILSVSEDICYNETHKCSLPNDRNTYIFTKKNGQRKCECLYKFYYTDDEYGGIQKICLDYDSECPSGYGKFVPETLECIKTEDNCPPEFSYLFLDIFCLRECPKNSTLNKSKKTCQCVEPNSYWHETTPGSGNLECLDKCLDKYPVYAPSTNQCLFKCGGSYYPYLYEDKCYTSCNNSDLLNIKNGFITENKTKYSNYTCECHNPWFYNDKHQKICADSMVEYSIEGCDNFTNPNPNYIYFVRKTLQCIDKCPKEYNYTFNFDCFEDCKEGSFYYHYLIQKENSYVCQCQNLWFYEPNNKIQCLPPNVTECIIYDYEDKFFDKKYVDKKYLVNETNECVNSCPKALYSFNYVCYDKCPQYTNDNENDHICKCNNQVGHWYEYERYNLSYLECAVEKCPGENINSTYIREHLLEKENKCLITCRENEEYPFSLRKVCVKECPYFTHTNGKENELNDTCLFYDLDDKDVNTLEKFKAAANVQAMELYKNSEKLGGFLFTKFNTTLQIYSIDRNDSLKDISFKSNLTYIDFGTCFDKMMIDKNITDKESILIAKYDIMPETNINIQQDISSNVKDADKYLINPVEYELFSSLTNEKFDALVCEPYEILISYPLCLSKFDKYVDGINQNEYRKKFEIGKELHYKDNEIDTFNFNNTIYTHFCKELEINGKDLVFEDRYKYLYPNNKLLCESNCTMNNTDFDLERVNCLCTYKDVFDFNRKEEEINDILNNPDFYLPQQSSTNAEIIKCLFNFTAKQAIIKNEMFYCCTIMTIGQIALMLVTSLASVKSMINDIRNILNKVNIKNYFLKRKKIKNNDFKIDNMISSTNRALNNPPKKNNDNTLDLDSFNSDENKNNNNNEKDNEIVLDKDKIYSSNNNKAEYIPPEYNFKFFKSGDKGVMKKIERSKLPFSVNPDTNYLIERRDEVDYDENYLNGPYLKIQNILVITDKNINKDSNENKDEKSIDNTLNLNNTKTKKRKIKFFDNFQVNNEKNFVEVKPMKSNLKTIKNEKAEFNPETELRLTDEGTGFFGSIKREQLLLRISYNKYLEKKHNNIYDIFFAEIFDKIYFIKTFLFLKKFDIFCVQFSLYIFYHILLLSILCSFFTVKLIKKIWEQDNFPDINFYLLYGLIANVIVWIIYQMFSCLLDFNDKIKDMITLKYELIENQYIEEFDKDNIHDSNEGVYKEKYDELIYQIKCRISLFYVIVLLFSIFFFIYLLSFFSFYTGTKHRVLEAYYISIIEIFLIKVVYGIFLAVLRYIGIIKRIKCIYNFVLMLDKYLS